MGGTIINIVSSRTGIWFWSSDKLTGSQTRYLSQPFHRLFWSSDKLTGSQTWQAAHVARHAFWSSDKLTDGQTRNNEPWQTPSSELPDVSVSLHELRNSLRSISRDGLLRKVRLVSLEMMEGCFWLRYYGIAMKSHSVRYGKGARMALTTMRASPDDKRGRR